MVFRYPKPTPKPLAEGIGSYGKHITNLIWIEKVGNFHLAGGFNPIKKYEFKMGSSSVKYGWTWWNQKKMFETTTYSKYVTLTQKIWG